MPANGKKRSRSAMGETPAAVEAARANLERPPPPPGGQQQTFGPVRAPALVNTSAMLMPLNSAGWPGPAGLYTGCEFNLVNRLAPPPPPSIFSSIDPFKNASAFFPLFFFRLIICFY